jgi:Ankyrin repeats (3 copies)/NACHT domain
MSTAGCGKTILSSTIIDQIADQIKEQRWGVLAFYYFSFRRKESQDVRLLLYSLLTQLVRGLVRSDPWQHSHYHLPRAFRELYSQYQPSSEPKVEDLKAAFLSVLAESEETYIVIDALDECPSLEDRESVIKFFMDFPQDERSSTHILITSRQEKDIEDAISETSGKNGIDLRRVPIKNSRVNADIRKHVQTRMTADSKFKTWSDKLKEEVIEQLTEKAEGVFRYAECQLVVLRLAEREKDIKEALKRLPKDLDETYSRMLSHPNIAEYADGMYTILQWLAYSNRPLRLSEAAEAIVFTSDRSLGSRDKQISVDLRNRFRSSQSIRTILSGLVTVSGSDNQSRFGDKETDFGQDGVITFAHFSVKEYLECDRVEPKRFRLLESDAQWFILESCLAYIHHYDTKKSEVGSERYPLLLYACKYWQHHALALCYDKNQRIIKAPTRRLTKLRSKLTGPTLTLSTRVALSTKSRSQKMLKSVLKNYPFLRMSTFAFGQRFEDLGGAFDFESDSALHLASDMGKKELVKLLLDCGTDVNKKGIWEATALHHAASSGHGPVVEELLRNGADIEKPEKGGGTPLADAIENGCEVVSKLLLMKGAKVNYIYTPKVSDLHPDPLY